MPLPNKLDATNTAWIFLSGSTEARHLDDIIFGVDTLRKRQVPDSNIFIFTDHQATAVHLSPYGITANNYPLDQTATELPKISGFRYVVMAVTGHGDRTGLQTIPAGKMQPAQVLDALRSCPNVDAGVVVLCQCYGGLFNFVDARTPTRLVVMGATNLNPSFSAGVTLNTPLTRSDGAAGLSQWQANIFMFNFFGWLRAPFDVDGDGSLTLMDAYKYAGVESNRILRVVKGTLSFEIPELIAKFKEARATDQRNAPKLVTLQKQVQELQQQLVTATAGQAAQLTQKIQRLSGQLAPLVQAQMQFQATKTSLDIKLDALHIHQEPWMLHANLAREIGIG